MAAFHRSTLDELCKRLKETPRHLISLYGPCQTGKTTMIHQALKRLGVAHCYYSPSQQRIPSRDLESQGVGTKVPREGQTGANSLINCWGSARDLAQRTSGGTVLVLDEIQEIPRWPNIVKGLWDWDRITKCPLHVVVLSSVPISLQADFRGLTGRFEPLRVPHWSFAEMADAFGFDLDQYIFYGGYPDSASRIENEKLWRSYVTVDVVKTAITRDLLSLGRVEKPAVMSTLFDLCIKYSGQILSCDRMITRLHEACDTLTLRYYLEVLSDAGLVRSLGQYSPRWTFANPRTHKLSVLNTALLTSARRCSFEEARADRRFWGRLVETAVGAHLVNSGSNATRVFYWRDGEQEVDFVLRRGPEVLAIDVRCGTETRPTLGMEAFKARFNSCRTLLVGEGGVPLGDFLSTPPDQWFEES